MYHDDPCTNNTQTHLSVSRSGAEGAQAQATIRPAVRPRPRAQMNPKSLPTPPYVGSPGHAATPPPPPPAASNPAYTPPLPLPHPTYPRPSLPGRLAVGAQVHTHTRQPQVSAIWSDPL
jgi:hypothetical protein